MTHIPHNIEYYAIIMNHALLALVTGDRGTMRRLSRSLPGRCHTTPAVTQADRHPVGWAQHSGYGQRRFSP